MNSTTAAARATTATWAVLNRQGHVVVLFGGTEAEGEAKRWRARGYRIAALTD